MGWWGKGGSNFFKHISPIASIVNPLAGLATAALSGDSSTLKNSVLGSVFGTIASGQKLDNIWSAAGKSTAIQNNLKEIFAKPQKLLTNTALAGGDWKTGLKNTLIQNGIKGSELTHFLGQLTGLGTADLSQLGITNPDGSLNAAKAYAFAKYMKLKNPDVPGTPNYQNMTPEQVQAYLGTQAKIGEKKYADAIQKTRQAYSGRGLYDSGAEIAAENALRTDLGTNLQDLANKQSIQALQYNNKIAEAKYNNMLNRYKLLQADLASKRQSLENILTSGVKSNQPSSVDAYNKQANQIPVDNSERITLETPNVPIPVNYPQPTYQPSENPIALDTSIPDNMQFGFNNPSTMTSSDLDMLIQQAFSNAGGK